MSAEIITGIVLGLLVNEFCDVSPWLARKVIWLAARCVPDLQARQRLEEEWAAGLQDRPGKILKLISALTILLSASVAVRGLYLGDQRFRRTRSLLAAVFDRDFYRLVVGGAPIFAVNSVSPWRAYLWAQLVTVAVFSFAVVWIDLRLLGRKRRRETNEASGEL